jgi:hypothetical protein
VDEVLRETVREVLEKIHLAQDNDQWRVFEHGYEHLGATNVRDFSSS